MAKLVKIDTDADGNEVEEVKEVKDNDNFDLVDRAEELGVAFGCQDGRCGSCRVEIVEGMENLTKRTQNEFDAGLMEDEPFRLACQCKIKQGLVKVRI
ncbi:(2Fe-2S)-binding protein [Candidatus Pacearchaeota archaeon]|nr:(2Fe-2S)-binding protein [Candidatus Pacearchaeota archaeon]